MLYRLILISILIGILSMNSSCASVSFRETPIVRVVKDHSEAVVNIRTEKIVDLRESQDWGLYGEQLDRFFKEYFGEDYSEGTLRYKSIGSGVIVDHGGLIVTNAHVVDMATSIYAVLKDGTLIEAKVIEVDQGNDLALLKTNVPPPVGSLKFADVKDIMIGETVIAIGSPLGLENSVTAGILSGKDRSFENSQCGYVCAGLLQTDAPINPGNSGGALFNLDGELIGINLAVVQSAQNIGFAVPIDKITALLEKYQ